MERRVSAYALFLSSCTIMIFLETGIVVKLSSVLLQRLLWQWLVVNFLCSISVEVTSLYLIAFLLSCCVGYTDVCAFQNVNPDCETVLNTNRLDKVQ